MFSRKDGQQVVRGRGNRVQPSAADSAATHTVMAERSNHILEQDGDGAGEDR